MCSFPPRELQRTSLRSHPNAPKPGSAGAAHSQTWTGCSIIQRDPLKLHGAPNINGLRITPDTVVGNFEAGLDIAEIHEQFPGVPVEDIRTVLNYAAEHGNLSRTVR
jgi:uncharacterized protein (DUF433 family)